MIIGNRTLTTRYILPFIFTSSELFSDKYSFVNAYVGDINRPFLDNHIIVLFKYNIKVFNNIDKEIKENPYFCCKYDVFINNEFYLEYVFIIPPEYKYVIKSIINGYFHSIDENHKLHIMSFWNNKDLSYLKDLLKKPKDLLDVKSLYERNEIVTEEDCTEENTFLMVHRLTQ